MTILHFTSHFFLIYNYINFVVGLSRNVDVLASLIEEQHSAITDSLKEMTAHLKELLAVLKKLKNNSAPQVLQKLPKLEESDLFKFDDDLTFECL